VNLSALEVCGMLRLGPFVSPRWRDQRAVAALYRDISQLRLELEAGSRVGPGSRK